MKILITGGQGYIGQNIIRYLMMAKNIEVVNIDRINGSLVEDINKLEDITHIVHLAAIPGVKDCEDNIEQATNDNILSTIHLFNIAYKNNIPVVFASSGSAQSPKDNFYATTKFIGEQEAFRLNNIGSNIKVLRFANIYGGINYFGNKSSVVAKFYEVDEVIINGDGLQTRDFIHVDDICRCIWLALNCNEVINEPMGTGTGVNTSILDLAKMFNKPFTFDIDSKNVGVDESPAEVDSARINLGFKANIALEHGIKSLL